LVDAGSGSSSCGCVFTVSNGLDDESGQRIFIDSHTKAEAKRTQAALMQAVSFYTSSCNVIPKREVKNTENSSRSKVFP
jgi:hypothetical protein